MSSLESLHITGIRSFPDNERSVIKFYKPLTIIVGKNGTGKTTIIECLKYACTGTLPPASRKGQAFIQDTKITNKSLIKSKVELCLKTTKNKHLKITRSAQLVNKNGKLSFQTIDTSVAFEDETNQIKSHTESSSNSSYIPLLIGVSSSILENVVFCHQEESNWPLEDDSKQVKKRFDEIFSSTKYTKALEHIESERKRHFKSMSELKAILKTQQVIKSDFNEKNKLLSEIEIQKQTFQEFLGKNKTELDKHIALYRDLHNKIEEINAEKEQLNLKNQKLETVNEELESLKSLPLRFDLSDEELNDEINNRSLKTDRINLQRDAYKKKLQNLNSQKTKITDILSENEKKLAVLISRKNYIQSKLYTRNEALKNYCSKYQIQSTALTEVLQGNNEITDEIFNQILESIKLAQDAAKSEAEEMLNQNKNKLRSINLDIKNVDEQVTLLKTKLKLKDDQISLTETSIENLKKKNQHAAELLKGTSSNFDDCEQLKKKLEKIETVIASEEYALRISNAKKVLKKLVEENKELVNKMDGMQKAYSLVVDSNSVKLELHDKLQAITNFVMQGDFLYSVLANKTLEKWISCFSVEVDCTNVFVEFKDVLQMEINQISSNVANLNSKRENFVKEIDLLKKMLSNFDNEIKNLETELQTFNINESYKDKIEFHSLIKKHQNELQVCELELSNALVSMGLYEDLLQDAQTKKFCPLCKSDLNRTYKMSILENSIEDYLKSYPKKISVCSEKTKNSKDQLNQLHVSQADMESYFKLNDRYFELKSKTEKLSSEIEARNKSLLSMNDKTTEARALYLNNLLLLIEPFLFQLESWKNTLNLLPFSPSKHESYIQEFETLNTKRENIENQTNEKNIEIKNLEHTYHNYLEESQLLARELKKNEIALSLSESYKDVNTKISLLESDLNEYTSDKSDLQQKLSHFNSQAQLLEKNYESESKKFSLLEEEKRKHIDQAYNKLDSIQKKQRKIISLYKEKQDDNVIDETKKQEYQNLIQQIDSEIEKNNGEFNRLEALCYSNNANDDFLDSTKRYRFLQDIKKTLETEIRAKEQYLISCVGENQLSLTDELKIINERIANCKADSYQTVGQLNQLTIQENDLKNKIDKIISTHGNVDLEYKKALVTLESVQMLVDDLKVYHSALENSVMKYHTQKMESINQMIQELWENIYKGQDIDYLKISTDNDESEATKNSKAFQYRVLMVKNGVEMEMKGRCSMGQKVLASIIIRMALAETFGINCGVLALDEPTTNLDRSNVESLASSLSTLIKRRENQSNFQLLVITHDEMFVRQLTQERQSAEFYWEIVKKDQLSKIRNASIRFLNKD